MHAPRGILGSELGDAEVITVEDQLHMFHLCVPNHDRVAHLVSGDGLSWEPLPTAITTGPPGAFDDDMIWTVSVVRGEREWVMLYTALSTAEGGRVQRIGRATSRDLVTWTKGPAPVSQADPAHYEATLEGTRWIAWRDPKPVEADGTTYAVVSAREAGGLFLQRGAVGLLVAEDRALERWTARPPVFRPRRFFELECPQIVQHAGRWYLIASVQDDQSQRYWMGEGPLGPWREPGDSRLAPPGHYAGRVCQWNGQSLLFCWHQGQRGRSLLSPLVLDAGADGHLAAGPYGGWDARAREPARPVAIERQTPGEMTAVELDPAARDVLLRAEVEGDATLWGFALGRDADGGGMYIEVEPGAGVARVVSLRRDAAAGWFQRDVVQQAAAPDGAGRGREEPRQVRLLVAGGEIELAVNGRVLLSTEVEPPAAGLAAIGLGGRIAMTGTLEELE